MGRSRTRMPGPKATRAASIPAAVRNPAGRVGSGPLASTVTAKPEGARARLTWPKSLTHRANTPAKMKTRRGDAGGSDHRTRRQLAAAVRSEAGLRRLMDSTDGDES